MSLKIDNAIDATNTMMSDGTNVETKLQTITNKLQSFGFVEKCISAALCTIC